MTYVWVWRVYIEIRDWTGSQNARSQIVFTFFFVDLLHHPSFFPLVHTHQKVFATHQKKVGEEDKGKEQEQEMEEYDKR